MGISRPSNGPCRVVVHLKQQGGFNEPTTLGIRLAGERGYQIRIPIYEGERFLRDLRIEGIDSSVNIGAEIQMRITIGKDYKIAATAIVVSTGQKTDIEFQIDRVKMPTIQELERDKERVLEEIENGLAAITDPNIRSDRTIRTDPDTRAHNGFRMLLATAGDRHEYASPRYPPEHG